MVRFCRILSGKSWYRPKLGGLTYLWKKSFISCPFLKKISSHRISVWWNLCFSWRWVTRASRFWRDIGWSSASSRWALLFSPFSKWNVSFSRQSGCAWLLEASFRRSARTYCAFCSPFTSQVQTHGETLHQVASSIVLYPSRRLLALTAVSNLVWKTFNQFGPACPSYAQRIAQRIVFVNTQ